MIWHRVGDLLEQPDLTHVAHQANLYHCFGAGLAAAIGEKWPQAAEADRRTPRGEAAKLGSYSLAPGAQRGEPAVINLYSQRGMATHYQALRQALTRLERALRRAPGVALGLPHGLGCGIAGGDWSIVSGIIEDVFGQSPVYVVIVELPQVTA